MNAIVAEKVAHPIVVLEQQLEDRVPEFAKALPAHIPPERFKRVVLTAVQNNPGLLKVERRSFFNACMKAAQDGLLPDGREGAIVEYRDKDRGPIAQWMPMIAGIRKKVRNSGEIADWNAHVVFENDAFEYELGDDPFIRHKPALGDRGKPVAAYSVATFKSGEKSREVMSIGEIEKIRNVSRAKDSKFGPWTQWWEEMARKTVARRHSKVLPMSTDMDDLLRRDDALYSFDEQREEGREEAHRPKLHAMLDRIGSPARSDVTDIDVSANGGEREQANGETTATPEQNPAGEQAGSNAADDAGASPEETPAPEAPASDQPDDDVVEARQQVLATLREAAKKGSRKLRLTLGKLTVDEMKVVLPEDHRDLEATAKQIDAKEGGE